MFTALIPARTACAPRSTLRSASGPDRAANARPSARALDGRASVAARCRTERAPGADRMPGDHTHARPAVPSTVWSRHAPGDRGQRAEVGDARGVTREEHGF